MANETAINNRQRNTRPTSLMVALLAIIAVVVVGAALREMRTVIIPLLFAWMLSQLLAPMMRFFAARRVPLGLATGLALVLLLFIFYWVAMFVSASAAGFAQKLPVYKEQVNVIVGDLISWSTTRFGNISNEAVLQEIRSRVIAMLAGLVQFVGDMVGALVSVFANVIVIFIIVAFMLLAKPYSEAKIHHAFASDMAERINTIMTTISRQLSHYLLMQFLISLATGLLVWLSCHLVGVGSAPTWGALAFFLNFIPTIGSILAGVPPVLLALLQFYPSVWPAVIILICIVGINQVLGSIVSPKVMGDRLNLSPVAIILSLLLWGWLWGIPGAFLSVVVACAIKIICDNIEPLRPIGVLMASGKSIARRDRDDAAEQAGDPDEERTSRDP